MLWSTPSASAMLISDAPPWLMNGSGMPVIGMIPITMPTFTNSWNRSIAATPQAKIVPNGSFERQPRDEHAPQERDEQREDHERADEAELLGEDREHEVRVLDRQQALGVLGAVREADARTSRPSSTAICAWSSW